MPDIPLTDQEKKWAERFAKSGVDVVPSLEREQLFWTTQRGSWRVAAYLTGTLRVDLRVEVLWPPQVPVEEQTWWSLESPYWYGRPEEFLGMADALKAELAKR